MTPRPYIPLIAVRCVDPSYNVHLRKGRIYHATFDQPPSSIRDWSGTLVVRINMKGKTLFERLPRAAFEPCNRDHTQSFRPLGRFGPCLAEKRLLAHSERRRAA